MDILLAVEQESVLGEFHPLLVHFPIVLFALTLVFDIINYLGRPKAFKVACWMLWSGTLIAIPTLITGWIQSYSFPPHDPIIHQHMILAFCLFAYSLLHSCFRIAVIFKQWTFPPFLFLILSFFNVVLTSATSDRGGLLSHGTTPFQIMSEKKI